MFYHNFKYSLKILLKNKMLVFWTFAFPIILGTLFNMAFSDIETSEKLDIIDIAIVDNDQFKKNIALGETFKILGDDNSSSKMFNVSYVDLDKAVDLLAKDKITGYLLVDDRVNVVIKANGINATVLKYITDEVIQNDSIITDIIKKMNDGSSTSNVDLNSFYSKMYSEIVNMKNEENVVDTSGNNLSYTMIEFYTLIAMACLYGGILSMVSINKSLANMSNSGKRISVSPTKKSSVILGSSLASYVTQLLGVFLLFIYTIFVLKVDYGDNLGLVILMAFVGSLAGLSLGIFVASVFKMNDNMKTGIIIAVTMFWCFLSGMMGITMKYVVDKNMPVLNKINPANMITDGFYGLYYYDTLDRYYFDLVSLLVFSLVLILISIGCLRRQKYDSI